MDLIRALLIYGQIDVIWVQCSIQLCVVRIHMVLETVTVYYFSDWCGIQCGIQCEKDWSLDQTLRQSR